MASALTAFEHGFSAHGSRMLDRRTVLVEREIQLHKQTWLTRLHALPTSNMLINLQYLLNAQPVYLFSGFFLPMCAEWLPASQSYRATNNQRAKKIHNIHNSDYK